METTEQVLKHTHDLDHDFLHLIFMITSTLHHLKSFPKFASANLDIIKAYILNQRLVTLGPDLFPFRDDVFFLEFLTLTHRPASDVAL